MVYVFFKSKCTVFKNKDGINMVHIAVFLSVIHCSINKECSDLKCCC